MSRYVKYTREILEVAVQKSFSLLDVIKILGLCRSGGTYSHIAKKIKEFNIDTSHFLQRGSTLGKIPSKLSADALLVLDRNNGRRESATRLRRALIEIGVPEKCSVCGVEPFWNGHPLTLQVDHIDGNPLNNQRENLRFICPNCHSQTPNFGVNNSKRNRIRKPSEIDPNWRHAPKPKARKVIRPSKEELAILLWEMPTSQLAKNLGISAKAIEKWAKNYGLTKPPRGYWQKLNASQKK